MRRFRKIGEKYVPNRKNSQENNEITLLTTGFRKKALEKSGENDRGTLMSPCQQNMLIVTKSTNSVHAGPRDTDT